MQTTFEINQRSNQYTKQKKPIFLTKYKLKSSNNSERYQIFKSNRNMDSGLRVKTEMPSNHQNQYDFSQKSCRIQGEINQTSSKLQQINFSHHNPETCVCSQCTCGRHFCQLHAIKPNLSKNTVYQKEFSSKKPIQNKVNICKQYDRLIGPNLQLKTAYLKDYVVKPAQIQRPKPKDLLKTEGPFIGLTSYTNGFPGYKGDNQYIKPTDSHVIDYFPIRCRSTYSRSFTGTPCKRTSVNKIPDNFKTGANWYGKTTYAQNFSKPHTQLTSISFKTQQKAQQIPKYSRMQTQTIYQNNYIKPNIGVCPAKEIMSTRSKGYVITNKSKFKQNSDYKSMDLKFKPLS